MSEGALLHTVRMGDPVEDQTAYSGYQEDENTGCCGSLFGKRTVEIEKALEMTNAKISPEQLRENVKQIKSVFHAFVDKYSDFGKDDPFQVQERELVELLCGCSFDSYGVILWIITMDELETANHPILWLILQFLGYRMPTEIVMLLMEHYSNELSRASPPDVDGVARAVMTGSPFPLATALVLAVFFRERAKQDLTKSDDLKNLSNQYVDHAIKILNDIQSDYLAFIVLEHPSFHNDLSPMQICIHNELLEFAACTRMGRITHAMWTKHKLLDVDLASDAFSLKDIDVKAVLDILASSPYEFYFTPAGYFTTEIYSFLIYLGLFTFLTRRRSNVDATIAIWDYYFWAFNVAFIAHAVTQAGTQGVAVFLNQWSNIFDSIISTNFVALIIMRSYAVLANVKVDVESPISVTYKVLWSFNILALWLRLLIFLRFSSTEGPLIQNLKNMLRDIYNFAKMTGIVFVGFATGLFFFAGGKTQSPLFPDLWQSAYQLFRILVGQTDWAKASQKNSQFGEFRSDVVEFMVVVWTFIAMIMLVNLLIGMMTTTFQQINERSTKEVLYHRLQLGYDYDRSTQILPPPFNLLVLGLFVLYFIFDVIVTLLSGKVFYGSASRKWGCESCGYLNPSSTVVCELCSVPSGFGSPKKSCFCFRDPFGVTADTTCCDSVSLGLHQAFTSEKRDEVEIIAESDWICAFCRNRLPPKRLGKISDLVERIRTGGAKVAKRESDFVKHLMPRTCPICFRTASVRSRKVYALEIISFIVFVVLIYIHLLILLCLWPTNLVRGIEWLRDKMCHSRNVEFDDGLKSAPSAVRKEMHSSAVHQSLFQASNPVWKALGSYKKARALWSEETKAAKASARKLREEKRLAEEERLNSLAHVENKLKAVIQYHVNRKMARAQRQLHDEDDAKLQPVRFEFEVTAHSRGQSLMAQEEAKYESGNESGFATAEESMEEPERATEPQTKDAPNFNEVFLTDLFGGDKANPEAASSEPAQVHTAAP